MERVERPLLKSYVRFTALEDKLIFAKAVGGGGGKILQSIPVFCFMLLLHIYVYIQSFLTFHPLLFFRPWFPDAQLITLHN